MNRILNSGLRLGTLATRFLFVFFLAKYTKTEDVGYYGIFAATVSFGVLLVGFEYHTYVNRNIVRSRMEDRGQMIKAHLAVSAGLYLAFLPIALLLMSRVDWPNHLVLWLLPILVLEHYNQEIFRLLVVMSKQISATLLLFVCFAYLQDTGINNQCIRRKMFCHL